MASWLKTPWVQKPFCTLYWYVSGHRAKKKVYDDVARPISWMWTESEPNPSIIAGLFTHNLSRLLQHMDKNHSFTVHIRLFLLPSFFILKSMYVQLFFNSYVSTCMSWVQIKYGFQLEFVSIRWLINHMTCYKLSALIGWNYSIQTGEQIL